jgi:hypothetical protein
MADHEDDLDDVTATEEATTPEEGFLDRLRGGGVGTEDPMIVGDVGPTDIPPGTDGGTTPLVTTDEPVDHLEV